MLPKYVASLNGQYMAVKSNQIVWTSIDKANTYPSKYAAKKHLRLLNVPENVELERVETPNSQFRQLKEFV